MKHLRFSIKNQFIGWLEWDQAGSSVNLISSSFLKELAEIIKIIQSAQIKSLVLISNKEKNFSAGADIKEIQQITDKKQVEELLDSAHQLFSQFEDLKLPKISAINGACLGGGLEWALCFDYRLASDSTHTKFALPEIQLGLIPGLGACIRLPKWTGLRKALKMILTGKSLTGKQALSYGLVSELVPSLVLEQRALELAQQTATDKNPYPPKNKYKDKNKSSYWFETLLKPMICFIFKKQSLKKTKGFYPAPLKAIELIKKTYHSPVSSKALKKEISTFTELLESKEAKNLIRLWILIDKAKKTVSETPANYKPIQKVAVIGAGVMGQSISFLLADKGFKVRLIDNKAEALCSALKMTKQQLEKQKSRALINSYELERKLNNLSVSQNFWGFKTMDLIIEALPEDLALKQKLISEVSKQLSPECLFVSNTSSLSILDLAKNSACPSHFFGLHFFNPAHKMPLLELCMTESQKESLINIRPFIKQIGKIPLFVKDSPGFIVNRLLASYLTESLNLFQEGCDIKHIDQTLKRQLGMPLGPFELMDKIGLDVCLKTILNLEQKGVYFKKPAWTKDLKNFLSDDKSNQGFYIYKGKEKALNPKTNHLTQEKNKAIPTDTQIIQRAIDKMFIEGNKLLEDKTVEQKEEIDLAMVLGAGFPAFLGGPMCYNRKNQTF